MDPTTSRLLRTTCRSLVALLLLTVLGGASAHAGELIRYRRADGSVGFAGNESSVPPGAAILTRKPTSAARGGRMSAEAPPIEKLMSGVRHHCRARYARDADRYDFCIADQTRAAFEYRDLVLEQRPGSEARRIVERCRRRHERGQAPDYRSLLACNERAQAEFESRTGEHPADLDVDRRRDTGDDKRRAAEHRLRQLREDQARADRELAIGRSQWGPRYRKAEREFHAAQRKTESIVERMRRRGCRENTLACGGLGPRLEAAKRDEEKKRRYLEQGIVEECRLAGCQPGWLR